MFNTKHLSHLSMLDVYNISIWKFDLIYLQVNWNSTYNYKQMRLEVRITSPSLTWFFFLNLLRHITL